MLYWASKSPLTLCLPMCSAEQPPSMGGDPTCKPYEGELECCTGHRRTPCHRVCRCALQCKGRQGTPQRACSCRPSEIFPGLPESSGRANTLVHSHVDGSGLHNLRHLPTSNDLHLHDMGLVILTVAAHVNTCQVYHKVQHL